MSAIVLAAAAILLVVILWPFRASAMRGDEWTDAWWRAGQNSKVRSFDDDKNNLVCWMAESDWAAQGGASVSISCQPKK